MLSTFAITPDPVELVNQASTATDRWLFFAALVFIMFGFIYALRYLVKKDEQASKDRQAERDKHGQWVETVYTENVRLTAQVLVCLQETNALLKRIEIVLAKDS